jgi:hypothetical protein
MCSCPDAFANIQRTPLDVRQRLDIWGVVSGRIEPETLRNSHGYPEGQTITGM